MLRRMVVLSAMVLAAASTASGFIDVGDTAPPISVGSWINLPKGMPALRSLDVQGQILLVEFWATW